MTDGIKPCAWAMRIPGCDGSADWAELGERRPEPSPPAVASPLYDQAAIDAAVEQANARQNAAWRLMAEKLVEAERARIEKLVESVRDANFASQDADDCLIWNPTLQRAWQAMMDGLNGPNE